MSVEVQVHSYTVAEFMQLPDDGKTYELIEGALIEMPGPSLAHGEIISRLFLELQLFLLKQPIGKVLNNTAFSLGPKTAPIPDLAFIQTSRLEGLDRNDAFPGPPDLVIEVMSPSDKWSEVSAKVQLYQQAGANLIWVVDPFDLVVNVYQQGYSRKTFLKEDNLEGSLVLPGFKVPVQKLFE